jgi:N-methylhydantoinase A
MAGVIVPLYPGVYSAMGLLMSDVKHDYIRSRLAAIDRLSEDEINAPFDELARDARRDLGEEGFADEAVRIEAALDMRYAGQGYEISVPCEWPLKPGDRAMLRKRFDELHANSFGHTAPDETVEIVSWRLRGVGLVPPVRQRTFKPEGLPLSAALRETRRMRFDGKDIDCPVYQREKLDVGITFEGPAVVDQLDCTTVVFPGQTVRIDEYRNMIILTGRS